MSVPLRARHLQLALNLDPSPTHGPRLECDGRAIKRESIMPSRRLVALTVYNEAQHVDRVLDQVRRHSASGIHGGADILVIDDGSTDGTSEILCRRTDIHILRHERNRGYGAALLSSFRYAQDNDYDLLVTIDCDGQHEPCRIPL